MARLISDTLGSGNRNRISYGRPANDGYKYYMKHGIGPNTIPSDVGIIRVKSWDNGMTFAWLDCVLSTDELVKFDIPSESELSKYECECEE